MVLIFLWCVQEVAGLKEDDLPSEDIAAASFSKCELLSVSHHPHSEVMVLFSACNSGSPDLSVKNLLTSCKNATDWYMLGIHLDLTPSQLNDIHVTYHAHGVERLKSQMFDVWLKSSPDASWTDLITALRAMDENTIASEI